jgi:hypothetical protein
MTTLNLSSRIAIRSLLATSLLLAVVAVQAKADVLDIGTSSTSAAGWKITGAGAVNAAPQFFADGFSVTSNMQQNGTFIAGGSLASFTGFYVAELDFTLAPGTTNMNLSFNNMYSDDRVVLELNGHIIGSMYLNPTQPAGVMQFADGGPNNAFTFTNTGSTPVSGGTNNASFFNVGGNNVLQLFVNNTDSTNPSTVARTFQNLADVTYVQMDGTLTSTAAPEPATMCLLALGGLALLRRRSAGK